MKAANSQVTFVAIAFALALSAGTAFAQDPTTEARNLLDFCLRHPEACSISIDYQKGGTGYQIDYNGTRLNPLASTVKVIHLLAYANAVDDNRIVAGQAVDLDEWARFWIGQDGGALASAYARLGSPPNSVTNDQIVSAMIQDSDNAAPDYLLNKLGSDYLAGTVERYVSGGGRGYMDVPQSLNAIFDSWTAGPGDPLSGQRSLHDYSGYESDEYRDYVDGVFEQMHHADLIDALRDYNGVILPWNIGPTPLPQPFPISESQYESLEKAYSARSNTRTYNQMMLGLLHRSLLTAKAQAIVEGFLEYKLKQVPLPVDLQPFVRYGVKDGSFAVYPNPVTNDGTTVRTRTIYAETKDGTEVVFTVQLTGTPGLATDLGQTNGATGTLDLAVRDFAAAVATNPAFAAEVQTRLSPKKDALAPSLVARIVRNRSTQGDVRLKVKVENIGTAPTTKTLELGLFFSDDGTTRGTKVDRQPVAPLQPGESVDVNLDSRTYSASQFFVLDLDPANLIPADQKQNNPQFEIVPGH